MIGKTAPAALIALVALTCTKNVPMDKPTVSDFSYAKPDQVAVTHMDLDLAIDMDHQIISGTAVFDLAHKTNANTVHFDTWGLNVSDVTVDGKTARWVSGDSVPLVGRPLSVVIKPDSKKVTVHYATTSASRGVQWLTPEQTAGKRSPYVYTQSESIHARSWVPCQDTPANRFTYRARLRVPHELMALMSARNPRQKSSDGVYTFEMNQPIPSYLLALAVGDIEYRPLGPRSGVYSEPRVVDAAAYEFADLEKMIAQTEALYGPYLWEQYDVLVLPPSFPFGGMENPRLTFATPTLIAGDRSLVSVITHELGHSWSGNLVTNATWNDFWLNEGFATYLERRLDEILYGREYMEMQVLIGLRDLDDEFKERGADSKDTALYVDLAGRDPGEVPQVTPYEKGYLFLRMMEESFGREKWDAFLRRYFDAHAFQSMTTRGFVDYLKQQLFAGNEAKFAELKVEQWIYGPGLPSSVPKPTSMRFHMVDAQIKAFRNGTPAKRLDTRGWTTNEWQRFLDGLPQPLPAARLADLEDTFHLSQANAHVQRSWYPNVIAANYRLLYPAIAKYLKSIGRAYLLRPVYLKLAETPDGLAFARKVYAEARPGYHSITTSRIDLVLRWNESQGQR